MFRSSFHSHFYDLTIKCLWRLLPLASPWSEKIRRGIKGREGLIERLLAFSDQCAAPYWFHVSSSGELEQAIPVMDELRRQRPSASILLTYFSPSGEKAARLEKDRRRQQGLRPPWDYSDYSPLDLKDDLRLLFKALRPKHLILVHRELWPQLIQTAHDNAVPTALISSYWPASPRKRDAQALKKLSWIGTVDEGSQKLIRPYCEKTPLFSLGDPRAERVLVRKNWNPIPRTQPLRPLFLLASLHKQDILALETLPEEMKTLGARWVVVPHDPEPALVKHLAQWLSPLGEASLYSNFDAIPPGHEPVIVDKVGLLAELYSQAHFVLVGGSFYYRVHNVWEPAAYHKPILTGPFIENSAEARMMASKNLLKVCHNEFEVAEEARRILRIPSHYQQISTGLENFLQSQTETSRRYVEKILRS